MSEQFLHRPQICAGIKQMGRERVPERMHRQPGTVIELIQKLANGELKGPHADAAPGAADEERSPIETHTLQLPEPIIALRLVIS